MQLNTVESQHSYPAATTRQEITRDLVKSCGRTLQILEYFSDLRRDATICEISRALGYPQSSTAALLHTLVRMGYMSFNRLARTYKPAGSLAFLGSWVDDRLAHRAPIEGLMEAVAERTRDMVLLGMRNSLYVKYVHVIQPADEPERHCANGTMRPLVNSGAAPALLCGLADAEIKRIAVRSNASGIALSPTTPGELVERVNAFRRNGYDMTHTPVSGIDMLTIALPGRQIDGPLALGIGGPTDELNDGLVDLLMFLQAAVFEHLGVGIRFGTFGAAAVERRVA